MGNATFLCPWPDHPEVHSAWLLKRFQQNQAELQFLMAVTNSRPYPLGGVPSFLFHSPWSPLQNTSHCLRVCFQREDQAFREPTADMTDSISWAKGVMEVFSFSYISSPWHSVSESTSTAPVSKSPILHTCTGSHSCVDSREEAVCTRGRVLP